MKNKLLILLLTGYSSLAVAQTPTKTTPSPSATGTVRDSLPVSNTMSADTVRPGNLRQSAGQPAPSAVRANPDSTQPAQTVPTGRPQRQGGNNPQRPAATGTNGGFSGMGTQNPPPVIPGTSGDNINRGTAKISGIILDSASRQPVEFASVALVDPATNKPIDGASANDKGQFTITRVGVGEFNLLISFVGYRSKTVRAIRVARRGEEVNMGLIYLRSDTKTLSEVTVTGQAAMIEEKVDRLVYNADKDIAAKGGDASDVMRKVPLLTVDLDGNVSLRGSSNVQVLINNKPSTIIASSVADALKQIPADMIKTVEVITSPSAKYDAEGSAGIINITTKKATLRGATLSLDTGVGNRGSNLGLNGSLRTGKMGFTLGGFGRASYNIKGAFDNTQTTFNTDGTQSAVRQTAETLNQNTFGQYSLGWDYDVTPKSNFSANVRFGLRNSANMQDNLTSQTTFIGMTRTPIVGVRDVNVRDNSQNVDANIDYARTYKPRQELSISAQFSRNNRLNNFIADIKGGTDFQTITSQQKNENPSFNQETTVKIDYETPIKENQLLEFGAKGILRQVNSDFRYFTGIGDSGAFIPDNSRPANVLNYNQNVAASYLSYTISTKKKYTIKAGARYEHTFIDASFSNESSNKPNIPDFSNLVPSINISKSLKGGKTVKLAYNRRIQRPGIQSLNPNFNGANPLNITQGNVNLRPELTDNFEFSTSAYVKAVYFNASVYARLTNNAITSITNTTTVQTGTDVATPIFQSALYTTFANIGKENAYGINLFGNVTLFSKWQIGGGVESYIAQLSGLVPSRAGASTRVSNSGMVISGRLNSNLTIKNGWGIQAFSFFRGRQVQLQGYQGGFGYYSVGVKKDFKNKRGSLGMAGENFFNNPFRIRGESATPGYFARTSLTSLYNAGVRVTFSYRFGKITFEESSPNRRQRGVNNDDVKESGSDNNQPQQAAPGGGGGRRPR